MPRNMIDANSRLFAKLAAKCQDLVSPDILTQKRAIRTDESEKEWLQQLKLWSSEHLILDSTSRFALGEYGDHLFLVGIGIELSSPPTELQPTPLNPGIFTAICSELDVPIIASESLAQQLLEYVFYPVDGAYELLDMDVVAPYFQKINVYLIDPNSAIAADKEFSFRAAIAAALAAPSAQALVWPETALERLGFMVRDPSECAPFHLLLRALTETRNDATFLALYRCVEQLFPVPKIAELSSDLGLSGPALGVAAAIERRLGWRRKEDDAIEHLFSDLDSSLIDRLRPIVGAANQAEHQARAVSKRIYDLRNQCVHFRPAHATGPALAVDDWATLFDLMLEAVQCLYAKYADAFTPE